MEEKVMSFGRMASITHAMQEACEHQYIKSEYTGGGGAHITRCTIATLRRWLTDIITESR